MTTAPSLITGNAISFRPVDLDPNIEPVVEAHELAQSSPFFHSDVKCEQEAFNRLHHASPLSAITFAHPDKNCYLFIMKNEKGNIEEPRAYNYKPGMQAWKNGGGFDTPNKRTIFPNKREFDLLDLCEGKILFPLVKDTDIEKKIHSELDGKPAYSYFPIALENGHNALYFVNTEGKIESKPFTWPRFSEDAKVVQLTIQNYFAKLMNCSTDVMKLWLA